MTAITEKLSCTYCSEKHKIYYICPNCRKRFCSEHRRPESHQCSSMKYDVNNNFSLIEEEDFKTPVRTENVFVHYPNPRISKLIKEIGERERLNKTKKHTISKKEVELENDTTMFRVRLMNLRTKT